MTLIIGSKLGMAIFTYKQFFEDIHAITVSGLLSTAYGQIPNIITFPKVFINPTNIVVLMKIQVLPNFLAQC